MLILYLFYWTCPIILADKKQANGNEDQQQESSTLFVKNIASSVDKDTLSEAFPGASEIRMPTKHDGTPKG